jgi:hypothetical protein
MVRKASYPDVESARKLLDELWKIVSREQNAEIDQTIDRLISSRFVSIRFCLPTQLLGKLTDSKLDCLCLQKGKGDSDSLWDPRSFANKVLVPWVSENQFVLGASTDPYVSKPLRKVRIEKNPGNVKGKKEWELQFEVLNRVESRSSEEYTRLCMLQTLRSVHKKLSGLEFKYYVPGRISIDQTEKLIGTSFRNPAAAIGGFPLPQRCFKPSVNILGFIRKSGDMR